MLEIKTDTRKKTQSTIEGPKSHVEHLCRGDKLLSAPSVLAVSSKVRARILNGSNPIPLYD